MCADVGYRAYRKEEIGTKPLVQNEKSPCTIYGRAADDFTSGICHQESIWHADQDLAIS